MKNLCVIIFVVFIAGNSQAMNVPQSAANCHCFQNRSFNQQKKFAADGYLLATSFNSFIAETFHISKSQIVMMKMKGGVDPDDLLLALYVSSTGQVKLQSVLSVLDIGGSWEDIFASTSLQPSAAASEMYRFIAASDKKTAVEGVTDQLLKDFFAVSSADLLELRREGVAGREMTLVFLLENFARPRKSAPEIVKMYSRQGQSWGEIAAFFGLTPKETGKLLVNRPGALEKET